MGRLKYYVRRLSGVDFKTMWKVAGKISQETGRMRLLICIDMVICSLKYQAGYMDYYEFEFYLLNGEERKTFITGGIANAIILKYNRREDRNKFADKSNFNLIFKDLVGRDFIDIRNVSLDEVREFLDRHEIVMVKVTDSNMGNGVERVESKTIKDVAAFVEELMSKRQFLIEEFFVQHPDMSRLYPKSVNTLRVITFFDGKDVHVLSGAIKMGNGANVDNFGAGGMYTVLDDKGVVQYPAFDKEGIKYEYHPVSHERIVGFQVPLYDEIVAMLDEAARRIPTIQYVGWDVAVGTHKPALIEGNYDTGVFQMKPSLSGNKTGLLPRFKKVIDI